MNGFTIDSDLIASTASQLILRHASSGLSSDVSWALSFCLEQHIALDGKAGKILSVFDDGIVALQALHMWSVGLLPRGFNPANFSKHLKNADLDREHWLFAYEAARQGFLNDSNPAVAANPLFAELLRYNVTFYRTKLPSYASVVHPGGAPEWLVRKWMGVTVKPETPAASMPSSAPIPKPIEDDLRTLKTTPSTEDEAVTSLLDILDEELIPDIDDLLGDLTYPG